MAYRVDEDFGELVADATVTACDHSNGHIWFNAALQQQSLLNLSTILNPQLLTVYGHIREKDFLYWTQLPSIPTPIRINLPKWKLLNPAKRPA